MISVSIFSCPPKHLYTTVHVFFPPVLLSSFFSFLAFPGHRVSVREWNVLQPRQARRRGHVPARTTSLTRLAFTPLW